jgi:hypothetical protein
LRGRDAPARPELVTDPAELERLLGVIAERNRRAARFTVMMGSEDRGWPTMETGTPIR